MKFKKDDLKELAYCYAGEKMDEFEVTGINQFAIALFSEVGLEVTNAVSNVDEVVS